MHKLTTALLGIALSLPAIAAAQNSPQQQDKKNTQQEQNQAAMTDEMGGNTMPRHTMLGTVSNNGKNFTSDNKVYLVNNPKELKNYDNQSVSVEFLFNTDNNAIHILSASPAPNQ